MKKNSKLVCWSLIDAFGVSAYVLIISWLLFSGEKLFGKMKDIWGPFILLLLLVFSAAVVGLLIFGRPVHLYLNGSKKEAIKSLAYTIGWLFLFTITALVIRILINL